MHNSKYTASGMKAMLWGCLLSLVGCTSPPKGIEPVDDFELQRYLGTWYEIARFDHSFERGLTRITATYSPRDDGGIDVRNRGYNPREQLWEEATGRAYFVGEPHVAHLKVSFFGPFYSAYVVLALDEAYEHALVTGPDRDYLWLLSRSPRMDSAVRQKWLEKARALGFDTSQLIDVSHPVAKQKLM